MNQVIDYLKTTFTTAQLVVFGVIAVALIVAVVLAIVFGCRQSRKNRAARKEEIRKQEEQKVRQSQLLAQVNSDIRQIETAMDETVRSAEKRKKELNDQEKIIADSEDVLNAADEVKFRDLADKENALSSLYKKQTTGPFKSMRKKKAAITLDTLEDVQADKGKLSDSIDARNRDRAYRKEILEKNLALIDTETEVRLYNLKAQRAELELKKHEIESESEKAVATKKMTKKEAQKYALEQNRRKKAAEEEEERKAKEEVRLAKEAYEKEKQRRIQTEKEVELALATLRDSEKEKRRLENEERKRARKAQYVHPVAISSGNELLLLEYEEEKVNTIIADAEDETEVVTAAETPAADEIIVTSAGTEQTESATEPAEETKAECDADEIPHEEVTTISVEEDQTEESPETETTESSAEETEQTDMAEAAEETTETNAPTEEDVSEEAEQTAEEGGYEAPVAEETKQTEEVAEIVKEETAEQTEEVTEAVKEETAEQVEEPALEETKAEETETAENIAESKTEENGYEAPVAEETEQTEEVAETVKEETAEQTEEPALEETKAEEAETANEEENTPAHSEIQEQENKEDNEVIREEEAVENAEDEIDNAVETEEAVIDAATEEETVENAEEEIAATVAAPLPVEEEEKPVKLYQPIYTDGIPATPINKKNKYQKPLTKIVVKDPSKRRYSDLPAAKLAAAQAEKKTSAAGETLKNKRNKELEQQALYNGKWVLEQNDIYYVATLYAANGEKMMQTEKYTSLSGIKNGIATIRKNMEAGNVTIARDNAGKFRFRVYSSGNRQLGTSESYSTEYQCEKAMESAKKFSETAVTIRL